jgi:hypothetical protein
MAKSTRLLAVTALTAALMAGSASAATINFSFVNTIGNVSGTVTGQIDGLVDNSTSAATAIYVDSYPAALGSYATPFNVLDWTGGTIDENSFTLSGGVVTSALFEITEANGDDDQLYLNSDCDCEYSTGHTNFLDIGSHDTLYVWNVGDLNASDGLVLSAATGTAGVPEPLTLSLFSAGVVGAVAMRRRKKTVG